MTFSGKFLNIHYNALKNELKIEFDNNDLMSGCPLVRKNLDFFEVRDFCKMVSLGILENLQKSGKSQGILKSCFAKICS